MKRVNSPYQTLQNLSKNPELFGGWLSFSDDTNLSPFPDFPVYQVRSFINERIHTSQGKGLTHEASLVSALMENLENRSLFTTQESDVLNTSYEELCHNETPCIDPVSLCTVPLKDQLKPLLRSEKLNWNFAKKIGSDEKVLAPSTRLFTQPYRWWSHNLVLHSNGLASGNNTEEALIHGMYELIERQSRNLKVRNQDPLKIIDIDSLPEHLKKFLQPLLTRAESLQLVNLSDEIGVPCIDAKLVLNKEDSLKLGQPPTRRLYTGGGCHANPEIALGRAVTECVQEISCLASAVKENLPEKSAASVSLAEPISKTELVSFESINPLPFTDDLESLVLQLKNKICAAGSPDVYYFDYNVPVDDFAVTLCLAPNFYYSYSLGVR